MANHRAREARVQIKVPVSFRDMIYKESEKLGISATKYLEDKKVVPID